MKTELDLVAYMPEVDMIQSTQLKTAVIAIWQELWARSSLNDLGDLKVSPEVDYPHVPHNRSVVLMACAIADVFERIHGIRIDRDTLVAGALLQDASKLIEMGLDGNGECVLTELGKLYPHAFWVTHLAINHGLPDELCEVLLNHTPQSAKFPQSLIGKILYYVDQLDVIAIHGDRWRKELHITKYG